MNWECGKRELALPGKEPELKPHTICSPQGSNAQIQTTTGLPRSNWAGSGLPLVQTNPWTVLQACALWSRPLTLDHRPLRWMHLNDAMRNFLLKVDILGQIKIFSKPHMHSPQTAINHSESYALIYPWLQITDLASWGHALWFFSIWFFISGVLIIQ